MRFNCYSLYFLEKKESDIVPKAKLVGHRSVVNHVRIILLFLYFDTFSNDRLVSHLDINSWSHVELRRLLKYGILVLLQHLSMNHD